MELIYQEMPKRYTLIQSSDWHLGPSNCYRAGINRLIERVAADKHCYLVLVGDLVDAVIAQDKRYAHVAMDFDAQLLTPQQQAQEVVDILSPIRDKIVVVGMGNHEFHHINTYDITADICRQIDAPYGGYCFKLIATRKGKPVHKFYFTHGNGMLPRGAKDPIQREANRKAALKRMLDQSGHADCVYMGMGHTHQLLTVAPTIDREIMLVDRDGELRQRYRQQVDQTREYIPPESRWYGNSGSFLRLYSESGGISYGEVKGYPPAEMGWLEIKVEDYRMVDLKKVVV